MIVLLCVLFLLLAAALAWLHAEKGWFRPTPHQWIVGHTEHLLAYAAVLLIVAIPAALIAALATSSQRPDREVPPPSPPELEVAIVGTESPRMTITNLGMRTATDVTYIVEAVNLDREVERGGNVFLPVPAGAAEILHPTPNGWQVELLPSAAKELVKNRQRVAGSITLNCGNCAAARSYSFYLVMGKEGWWWPRPQGADWGRILEPSTAAARATLVRNSMPGEARRIGNP
jgi:hypothetical protein